MTLLSEIAARVEADVAEALDGELPLGDSEATLARLVADASAGVEAHVAHIRRQIDPGTSTMDQVAQWGALLDVPRFAGQASNGLLTASDLDGFNAWGRTSVGDRMKHEPTGREYEIVDRIDTGVDLQWDVRYLGPVGPEGDEDAGADEWTWVEGDETFPAVASLREGYTAWTDDEWRDHVVRALGEFGCPGCPAWYALKVSLMPGVFRAWHGTDGSHNTTVYWIWNSPTDGPTDPDARHEDEVEQRLEAIKAFGHGASAVRGVKTTLNVTVALTPNDSALYGAVRRAISGAVNFRNGQTADFGTNMLSEADTERAILRVPGVVGVDVSDFSILSASAYASLGSVTFA